MNELAMRIVPPRFHGVSFNGFVATTESQAEALKAVTQWLGNLASGPMLALVGKQGTGKSHLLYSAVHTILGTRRIGQPAPYVASWYRLADELRYGKTIPDPERSRRLEGADVRAGMWERNVVLIDEIRPTSGTGFDDTELAKFACHAYDNRIAVLVTTNVMPLENVMGDAAASRFAQVVIDGPDARQESIVEHAGAEA